MSRPYAKLIPNPDQPVEKRPASTAKADRGMDAGVFRWSRRRKDHVFGFLPRQDDSMPSPVLDSVESVARGQSAETFVTKALEFPPFLVREAIFIKRSLEYVVPVAKSLSEASPTMPETCAWAPFPR